MANVTYKVQKGDTLSGIAMKNNTTVDNLIKLNPDITNRDLIYVGQVIIISGTPSEKTKNNSQKAKITNFGLQSHTDRTIFATWAWDKNNTENYEVKWMYGTGDGVGFVGNNSTVEYKQSTYDAPANATHVAFYVRPISKTYKTKNNNDVKYWNADWSTVKRYYFTDPPKVPTVIPDTGLVLKDLKLTITLNNIPNDINADSIQFQVSKEDNTVYQNGIGKISANKASYSCNLRAGEKYKVRSRSIKGTMKSEWSDYSSLIETIPGASDGIYLLYALSSNMVSINWYDVGGVDSYEIQYTTTKRFFDSSSSGVNSVSSEVGHAEIVGLEPGKTYFFRVRSIKNDKKSAWCEIKSISLGTQPSPPTTWSSTTTAKVGEDLYLYWVHNSTDGSRLMKSQLELTIGNETKNIPIMYGSCSSTNNEIVKKVSLNDYSLKVDTSIKVYMDYSNTLTSIKLNVNGTGDIDVKSSDKNTFYWNAGSLVTFTYTNDGWVLNDVTPVGSTESYYIDTTKYGDGTSILWRVKTAGILKNEDKTYVYSEYSVQRKIDILASPTISINITDNTGDEIDELKSFPFNVAINSGPNTQTPLGYFISITNNEAYEDVDEIGNIKMVNAGSEIYYLKKDTSERTTNIEITAGDINLKNNITYKVTVMVSMNSGLTGETSKEFTVSLEEPEYWPNAEISYDSETYTTSIRPYCENENGTLIDGITLSVYRREFDGSFTELAKDINNVDRTYVTDPHPSLDYARYRIVATDSSSGAISYYDVPGYPIEESSAIIQWDEKWSDFDITNDKIYTIDGINYIDELEKPAWSGSLVKLQYNIDVSDDNQIDVSLIKYIGRKYPVSYYGTHIGSTSTWSMEIPKEDKLTLYALRRLAIWTGNVYVREPSGSGYWANISLSFSQTHNELTIPISIKITRVEGGK